MNSKRVGCLISVATAAVLVGSAAWILSATGDRENLNTNLIIESKFGDATDGRSLLDQGAGANVTGNYRVSAVALAKSGRFADSMMRRRFTRC